MTPPKAKKTVKKAAKRVQPKLVLKEAPPSPEAEKRRIVLEEAARKAGVDVSKVQVFNHEVVERDEPLAIALAGTNTQTGEPFVEVFKCLNELPAGNHTNLLLMAGDKFVGIATDRLVSVLKGSLYPEDYDRYESLIFDAYRVVDIFQLASAASYLVERYTGLPTGPSTD